MEYAYAKEGGNTLVLNPAWIRAQCKLWLHRSLHVGINDKAEQQSLNDLPPIRGTF